MADESARGTLSRQSRSDLVALVADTWVERGWTVEDGNPAGADVLVTREDAFAERLAIVVVDPGQSIDPACIQRAAGIREQVDADVVLVVGTDEVTDEATALARREALNVKVLDGWGICRVLEAEGLLDRVSGGSGGSPDDGPSGESTPGGESAAVDDRAATASGDQAAVGRQGESVGAAEAPGRGRSDDGDGSPQGASTVEADLDTPAAAADNETPCPACGEAIFRPLIEQGLQCPYCDADFES
jgi:hypothetical protein